MLNRVVLNHLLQHVTCKYLWLLAVLPGTLLLLACGGGGGGSHYNVSTDDSVPVATSSSSVTSQPDKVLLSGKITYDFIPHNTSSNGLDYSAIEARPARGVMVELLDQNNVVIATSASDDWGNYHFSVVKNIVVSVRVRAQLYQPSSWNFRVTDNTKNNSLYTMTGSLLSVGEADSIRELHAPSGWTGSGYTDARVAAPFAILDAIYTGLTRLNAAGNTRPLPDLEFRWSENNKAAQGDAALGEIGSSFYDGEVIYVLGDKNSDADEYDSHVILHEWAHYIEQTLSRSDSMGGIHANDKKLDFRLAMAEGFANAFAAMMLDDPIYRDASDLNQTAGFQYDISQKKPVVRGWYSEASVESVLYNYYVSDTDKQARDFSDIIHVITSPGYIFSDSLTSIFLFANELRNVSPQHVTLFDGLLAEQNISGVGELGLGESNSGGSAINLPVYKNLNRDTRIVHVCSTNLFGPYNKLSVSQFVHLSVDTPDDYNFFIQKDGGTTANANPDVIIYQRGNIIYSSNSVALNVELFSVPLFEGNYIVEIYEANAKNLQYTTSIDACFAINFYNN